MIGKRFIGLMSGTSIDGIDAALVRLEESGVSLEHTFSTAYGGSLRDRVFAVARGETADLHSAGLIDRELGYRFAEAAEELLRKADVHYRDVQAIGSHGQTVLHHPAEDERQRFTLQLGDPSTIAEQTGITTVADFRRRDIAAGGQGAPLVPLFHAAQFGRDGESRAIVNIGGIANATLLRGRRVVAGFDCGPGNTLLDSWVQRHRGEPCDRGGAWAAEHEVDEGLLLRLLDDAFLRRSGPRSTGPEHFNIAWLERALEQDAPEAGSVQATLCELTARSIVDSLAAEDMPDAVFVCGGGARNTDLMRRLNRLLETAGVRLGTTDELGLAAEWVEACAFAWLAAQTLAAAPGNAPTVTGARGPRILGSICPAGERPG